MPQASLAGLYRSKAETLQALQVLQTEKRLCQGRILPLYVFSSTDWQQRQAEVLAELAAQAWSRQALIVRSSAAHEDSRLSSLAGHYLSLANVTWPDLPKAIDQVIAAYHSNEPDLMADGTASAGAVDLVEDQVLIQPLLTDIALSGVLFSHEPSTGAPYLVINYDESSERADTVTSGSGQGLRTRLIHRSRRKHLAEPFDRLEALLAELEALQPSLPLDLEFAFDRAGELYLFQVRPLICLPVSDLEHGQMLSELEAYLQQRMAPHPYLHGQSTVLGIMPDWNPAEIIGIRPRPLARTLYQELVTDAIWAYQRDNYGYRNLRSFPLMLNLSGCPYIDVRVSFNSFLPADLSPELAEKLLNYYLSALLESPDFHDKVEFKILFSCYTLDLPQRFQALYAAGFSAAEIDALSQSLRHLTNRIIHFEQGLWKKDIAKLSELERRWQLIRASELDPIARIYWLLEDCKRYGTLPFAGLARAGFIAVQMLRSLVHLGILSSTEYQSFMQSLDTVSSRIQADLQHGDRAAFLQKYGHLRPGTYDILSPRYDERPELYFPAHLAHIERPESPNRFVLELSQLKAIRQVLSEHALEIDVLELFDFIKAAIEAREYAKFMFTRQLSDVLQLIGRWAESYGFTRDEASYLDIALIQRLYAGALKPEQELAQAIAKGQEQYARTTQLILPPLLTRPDQVWQFEVQPDTPNFVTLGKVCAPVVQEPDAGAELKGCIVMIEHADPGYDWLFSRQIGGLITMYGGMNSHMAIRAGEMGIPAVIGAGQVLFRRWQEARLLEIDCVNGQVKILQ